MVIEYTGMGVAPTPSMTTYSEHQDSGSTSQAQTPDQIQAHLELPRLSSSIVSCVVLVGLHREESNKVTYAVL